MPLSGHARSSPPVHVETFIIVLNPIMYRLARCLLDPAGPRAPAPGPGPELRPPARAPGPGPRPWAPGPGLRGCAGNPIMYPAVRCSLDPLSLIRFRSSPSCTWNPPGDIEPKARGTLQEDQDPESPRVSIIDSLVSTSTS